MKVCLDIEADGLEATKIHVVVTRDVETQEAKVWKEADKKAFAEFCRGCDLFIGHNIIGYDWYWLVKLWGITLDATKVRDTLILSQLFHQGIEDGHSLEAWGERLGCLKQGTGLNDFSRLSPELLERCIQDTAVNLKLYRFLNGKLDRPEFREAIDVEHRMAFICLGMHLDGFAYNKSDADILHSELSTRLNDLDREIGTAFRPKAKLIREVKPRRTKFGTLNKQDFRWFGGDDLSSFGGGPFSLFEYVPFDPNSIKQNIERLEEAGWKPVDKTKTGNSWKLNETNIATLPTWEKEFLWRDKSQISVKDVQGIGKTITQKIELKNKFNPENTTTILTAENAKEYVNWKNCTDLVLKTLNDYYINKEVAAKFVESTNHLWLIIVTPQDVFVDCSAACAMDTWVGLKDIKFKRRNTRDEEVLATLPETAPKEASLLVERLLVASRVRTLETWAAAYKAGRIHGRFHTVGTWTHRMRHTNPNMGNIAAHKTIKYRGEALRKQAIDLGAKMRSLWISSPDTWLVGTDAVSIQLRVFAHYIKDPRFTESLIGDEEEKKRLGQDPHSLNAKILGVSRDSAKTFIYAFLLGAGDAKIGEILGVGTSEGRLAKERFIQAYPGLVHLRKNLIPRDAKRGYFQGFDGRLIVCDSEHHMLAGYLQAGEAIVMKHACIKWREDVKKLGIRFRQVNLVHDEIQTEVFGNRSVAEKVGQIQADAIRWAGEKFKLNCPMAGSYQVGKNWLETH